MFDQLSEKINGSIKKLRGQASLTEKNMEDTLREIRLALLEADVHFKVVKQFINGVKEKAKGTEVLKGVNPGQQLVKIVHEELTRILGENREEILLNRPDPVPVLMVGLQGVGKTTLTAKLALFMRKEKKRKPMMVPCDINRPAAKKQLQVLGEQIQVPVFDSDLSKSPAKIAEEAKDAAIKEGCDLLLIDTAGRLQIDEELMGQLKDLKSTMDPAEILFVADAMTGQEAVNVAQSFHEQVGVTGIALTKMDGDARGGAALSIKAITGLSVKVVSVGEKPSDIEPFYPDRVASRILDMGDVLSLVEKAQENITEEEALATAEKLKKNAFDIEDFQKQLHMMNKMGSLESILKMMPGAQGMLSKMGDLSMAEKEMKKIDAIICSMTREEKSNHKILNGSRRKRIAQGSGTQVQDVNRFIQQFNQMNKMMGKVQKMGLGGLMKGLGKGGMPKFPF